jgi:hypothetical protein
MFIMKEVIERAGSPTPPFFRKLRNIGIALTGISAAILTSPVSLPALLASIAGYAAVGGAMSQLVRKEEE